MGTDVALMLGIAHTLMTQGKHDKVFLEKYTTGYPQFEEYLTGKSDNTPKSAAWAAEITGVPEAQIVKLAELMAANRTMLMAGWGIQRQQYGEQKHWMLVTLAAMLGQLVHRAAGLVSLIITPTVATRRVLAAYCQKCLRRLPDRQVRKLMMAE